MYASMQDRVAVRKRPNRQPNLPTGFSCPSGCHVRLFYGRLYTIMRAWVFATGQVAALMPAATATRWCASV
jgi:hypothetical protein